MAKLFGGAYAKSASVQNAVNGFRKPGIWPYDPNVFGDEDYAPSTMTDRPFPESPSSMTEGPLNDAQSTVGIDPCNGTSSNVTVCALNESPATTVTAKEAVAESSTQSVISEIETERSTTPLPNSNILEAASLTPFQIRPIPTMATPKTGRKHKRQKSEVLTSTPVKAEQALKFRKPNNKKTKISELAGPSKTKTKRPSIKQQNKNRKPDFYCLV